MYTLLMAFFLVAIVTSFLCSLWEAVLLSTTPREHIARRIRLPTCSYRCAAAGTAVPNAWG